MTIELWSVDLDDLAGRPGLLDLATAGDRAAAGGRRDLVRRRFLARRAATRLVLGRSLGVAVDDLDIVRRCPRCGSTAHGRPTLSGDAVQFSVTASGPAALIAVSAAPVGVDLELTGADTPAAQSVLAAAERALLDSCPAPERNRLFLRLWTAKEAVLKADGRGLSLDPALVDASAVVAQGVAHPTLDGRSWTVRGLTPVGVPADAVVALADEVGAPTSSHALGW